METLVLDGKQYVKASKAARDLGYATDYVGQLCRSGKVDAHLIGRTWYVDQDQLAAHRVEKKRMSRVKAREQAKALIASARTQSGKTASSRTAAQNLRISYEPDEAPLIPETRKLSVSSDEMEHAPASDAGQVSVVEDEVWEEAVPVEETEDTEDTEVPETEPAPSRTLNIRPESRERSSRQSFEPLTRSTSQRALEAPSSFMERLQEASVIPEAPEEPLSVKRSGGSKYSLFIHSLFHTVLVATILASFALQLTMTHDTERSPRFESHFSFSVENTVFLFRERL